MATKIHRCDRCGRRLRNPRSASADGWFSVLRQGLVVETFCPDCTTPMQRAESVMAETTTELGISGELIMQRPKIRVMS